MRHDRLGVNGRVKGNRKTAKRLHIFGVVGGLSANDLWQRHRAKAGGIGVFHACAAACAFETCCDRDVVFLTKCQPLRRCKCQRVIHDAEVAAHARAFAIAELKRARRAIYIYRLVESDHNGRIYARCCAASVGRDADDFGRGCGELPRIRVWHRVAVGVFESADLRGKLRSARQRLFGLEHQHRCIEPLGFARHIGLNAKAGRRRSARQRLQRHNRSVKHDRDDRVRLHFVCAIGGDRLQRFEVTLRCHANLKGLTQHDTLS